jgi:hypothetical protein
MKKKPSNTPQNNSEVSYPFCRPDDYYTRVGVSHVGLRGINQANMDARIVEKCRETDIKTGGKVDYNFNPEEYRIRQRYIENVVLPGSMTHDKTKDKII